jgi:hypothetical protein
MMRLSLECNSRNLVAPTLHLCLRSSPQALTIVKWQWRLEHKYHFNH